MKKILGSLLILTLSLFAKSTYEWKIELKETELYLHQATVLSMECSFSKEGKNDGIEFSPPKDIPFDFELLSENRHFTGEKQTLNYKYLVFAKEIGTYELKLRPVMLFTSQSAIDNVIVGRDNINDLEVEKEIAEIDPIIIRVDETSSSITGRLSLKTDIDVREVSAYEPVHLEIALEGEGNLQDLKDIGFEIEDVQVFSDEVESKFSLSEDGYKGEWIQRLAFVGKRDFIIPSISIHYFDPQDEKEKVLNTEACSIKVKEDGIKREDLIDKVNLPSQEIDFTVYIQYVYCLLSFLAGFVLAKLFRLPKKTVKKEKGIRIKKAKNVKELLEVLIVCEKNLFALEIEELERAVYKGDTVKLSDLKDRALSKL